MCCLFGIVDHQRRFNAKEKTHILSVLATACEERGTDATGIAYCSDYHLSIYKRPLEAHRLRFRVPEATRTATTTLSLGRRMESGSPWRTTGFSGMIGFFAAPGIYRRQKSKRTAMLPSS